MHRGIFLKDNPIEKIRLLRSYHNEIGLHSLGVCAADKETGVTFHSGPLSSYWTGLKQTNNDEAPLYTEFLQIQTLSPTIIFNGSQAFVTTPLHFPAELSSKQNYNNSIHKNFREFLINKIGEQANLGGHIILASHPDITDNYIDFFLNKFSLDKGWCAPVGEVVERVKDIYFNSQVKIFSDGQLYYINSQLNLINLTIRLHYPTDEIETKGLDIKAKSIRSI